MKLALILFAAVFTAFLFPSCDYFIKTGGNDDDKDLQKRDFWTENKKLAATDGKRWEKVTASLVGNGEKCLVYAQNTSVVSEETGALIAGKFDNEIYVKTFDAFGSHNDYDADGKVIILLYDIIDTNSVINKKYVSGDFNPVHMDASDSHSNKTDMIFVDTNPQVPGSEEMYATIAHEYTRLIVYSQTKLIGKAEKTKWIVEGLAGAAEYLCTGDPKKKIKHMVNVYNSVKSIDPNVADQITYKKDTFYTFSANPTDEDIATAYLFFVWLKIHAQNGTAIYKKIIENSKADYGCVIDAANDSEIDKAFNSGNDWTWADLIGFWFIANYYLDVVSDDSIFGYKNDPHIKRAISEADPSGSTTKIAGPFNSNIGGLGSTYLKVGEGFYATIGTTLQASDFAGYLADITYVGLGSANISGSYSSGSAAFTLYLTPPYPAGAVLLAFNGGTQGGEARARVPKGAVITPPPGPPISSSGSSSSSVTLYLTPPYTTGTGLLALSGTRERGDARARSPKGAVVTPQ